MKDVVEAKRAALDDLGKMMRREVITKQREKRAIVRRGDHMRACARQRAQERSARRDTVDRVRASKKLVDDAEPAARFAPSSIESATSASTRK